MTATLGTYVHKAKTRGEDHSLCLVEFENGTLSVAENSWAKPGGVDDRCEIHGSKGNTRADLLRGSALWTYSDVGYGYAVEKAETTKGWTFTMFEEIWNYGFPQEMRHFVRVVKGWRIQSKRVRMAWKYCALYALPINRPVRGDELSGLMSRRPCPNRLICGYRRVHKSVRTALPENLWLFDKYRQGVILSEK